MRLSIIIPAYNEAQRLPATLSAIFSWLGRQSFQVEVIVVDDGSRDGTAEYVRQSGYKIRLIQQPKNLGKGAAIRTGMLAATGEWRYTCDADLSTPIDELDHLLTLTDRADVIIGSRRMPGSNVTKSQVWWKVRLGQLGNLAIQTLAVRGIHDTQCGFKLFHHRTMPVFTLQRTNRFGYDFEVLYLVRRGGWSILEVPVRWANDPRSTVTGRDYFITLGELLKLQWNRARGYYQFPR